MQGFKITNEYSQAFGRLYANTPKAVFAAVAFSFATWACGEESKNDEQTVARFVKEWQLLFENGIVPQHAPIQKGESDGE